MSFKDLTAFNLAMLGKQAWKFMSEPHSLVSRIFKVRYFPNNSFMSASLVPPLLEGGLGGVLGQVPPSLL